MKPSTNRHSHHIDAESQATIRKVYDSKCAYCGLKDFPRAGFSVELFKPRAAGGSDEPTNLVYCCAQCNHFKRNWWPANDVEARTQRILHPKFDDLTIHLRENPDGTLEGLTEVGRFHINLMQLNRPVLVRERLHRIQFAELEKILAEAQKERDFAKKQLALEARHRRAQLEMWRNLSSRSAHKIGNQVFAALGDLKLIERRGGTDIQGNVGRLKDCLKRIDTFLAEFRRYNREEPLKRVPSRVDNLVVSVIDRFRNSAPSISIQFQSKGELPACFVDTSQFQAVIEELVENAIHHTPSGGQITVTAKAVESENRLQLTVADTGPGIPKANKRRIFEPFFGTRPGGTGLGLAIVRNVVENHGGRIEEIGEPGKGAVFEIIIPIKPSEGS